MTNTPNTPLWHREPRRVDSKAGRTVTFVWDVEARADGSTLQVVLQVSHAKAGINYSTYERTAVDTITAGVRQQVAERHDGYTTTSFVMFSGVRIGRWEDGTRFSFKRLQERADAALTMLRQEADLGSGVAAYFVGAVDR